jgi:glycerophosphoryl diester phosphodiesterase
MVLGHRGDSEHCPENTLGAFDSALRAGADGIELDVRLSTDEVPMVMHDPSLLRTLGADVLVGSQTAAELLRFGVPTLGDALELVCGRGVVAIEIKDDIGVRPQAAATVVSTVRRTCMGEDVMLLAFDHSHLTAARALDSELFTVALVTEVHGDIAGALTALHIDGIGPLADVVDAELVVSAHAAGIVVAAWTVDDDDAVLRLRDMGCDVLITNRPAAVVSTLRR